MIMSGSSLCYLLVVSAYKYLNNTILSLLLYSMILVSLYNSKFISKLLHDKIEFNYDK